MAPLATPRLGILGRPWDLSLEEHWEDSNMFSARIAALLSLLAIVAVACAPAAGPAPTVTPSTKGAPAPDAPGAVQGKPSELKVGVVVFLSGSAAVFGEPAKAAAEVLFEQINAAGGIGGAPIAPIYVDEAGGPEKQVAEYRRLALDEKVDLVIGYISSADCLAVAPVVEELKKLTVLFDCGTNRIFEDEKYKYLFRTAGHQVLDSVGAAKYLLSVKPDLRSVAGINQDYAWGRDSWETFEKALKKLKPDVTTTDVLWPKLGAGEYSAEISKLLAARPDVIHSSLWGGDLVAFVKQAGPRGLFTSSLVLFTPGEHALQDLGKDMPEGVAVGARGHHWYEHTDPKTAPLLKSFVDGYRVRTGRVPNYPAFHMAQAVYGIKAAYEKALSSSGGKWPDTDALVKAFEDLTFDSPNGPITVRADHQAVEAALFGITRHVPDRPFAILDRIQVYPADEVNPPLGTKSNDWIERWKP
jgi:branched-chain amino acid transport system substrate-binding protein